MYRQGGGGRYYDPSQRGRQPNYGSHPRGGRGGRPFHGRGGGRFNYNRKDLESRGLRLKTNCFEMEFLEDGQFNIFQYRVEIKDAKPDKVLDSEGKTVPGPDGKPLTEMKLLEGRKSLLGTGDTEANSSVLTRRILSKCAEELKHHPASQWFFVTDGSAMAYAPSKIPENLPDDGLYVQVKAECEESHPDANKSKKSRWYLVSFTETAVVPYCVIANQLQENDKLNYMLQAINTAIKFSTMTAPMTVFGKDTQTSYWPMEYQRNLLGRSVRYPPNERGTPIVGLSQSAHVSSGNTIVKNANLKLRFALSETGRDNGPIPLLKVLDSDGSRGKLLGEDLSILNPITQEKQRKKILEELNAVKFHIQYAIHKDCDESCAWVKKKTKHFEDDGVTREAMSSRINEEKCQYRANRQLWKKGAREGKCVVHFNPSEHKFQVKDKKTQEVTEYTVEKYYWEHHHIKLQYPQMPLVRISKNEYFPVEFLFQAFDVFRGSNTDLQIKAALQFHDQHACTPGIASITEKLKDATLGGLAKSETEMLERFNLGVQRNPLEVQAKVLREPKLQFAPHDGRTDGVFNGSWNLQGKRFSDASSLPSFAVVDLTNALEGGTGNPVVLEVLDELLTSCQEHGMNIGHYKGKIQIDHLKEHFPVGANAMCPDMIKTTFESAVNRAKRYFLQFEHTFLSYHEGGFKTTVRIKGELEECLVFPVPVYDHENKKYVYEFAIVPSAASPLPESEGYTRGTSHLISGDPNNPSAVYAARCGFQKLDDGTFLDIFDATPAHEQEMQNNPRGFREVFLIIDTAHVVPKKEATIVKFAMKTVPIADIECPSVVFFFIPKKDKQVYTYIKKICDADSGIQSQVIVKDTWAAQRNRKPYFSNIALKLNTKLSSFVNRGSAWKCHTSTSLLELSGTLVIGLAMAKGQGSGATMVVAGTGCMDTSSLMMSHSVGLAESNPIIPSDLLARIVKDLVTAYEACQGSAPKRLLIYRSGGQDGMFQDIKDKEIACVRSVLQKQLGKEKMPPVTFLICQDGHNLKFAPASGQGLPEDKNVPSGTCIADSKVLNTNGLNKGKDDFLLIPHGGLKGTSKAVYYRFLLNENEAVIPKERLLELTYALSFQYGTATKAPRENAVVQYSTRLANLGQGMLPYLMDKTTSDHFKSTRILDEEHADMSPLYTREQSGSHRVFPHHGSKLPTCTLNPDEPFTPFHSHIHA